MPAPEPGPEGARLLTIAGRYPWSAKRQIAVFGKPQGRLVGRIVPNAARPRQAPVETAPLRIGGRSNWYSDLYHQALVVSWPRFLVICLSAYLVLNVAFGLVYMIQAGSIDHARAGSFQDAFFFSVQTMATIGYGVLTPATLYANLVVTAETMVSLVFTAFFTGLTFARYSRPTARVNFAAVATIHTHNGAPTLSVRMANARQNQIVEATVTLTLLRSERTAEGEFMRRFYDLKLSRSRTPIFALSFMAMHTIEGDSPFLGATSEQLAASDAELLVTVTGLDGTMTQTIHARASYGADQILFGYRYVDMFGFTAENRLVIDNDQFHAVRPDA